MKAFGRTVLTSSDFGTVVEFEHRLTFSPNQLNSVFINNLGQGIYVITNPMHIPYVFSVSRGGRPVAAIEQTMYGMTINKQWRIKKDRVYTRPMSSSPDIHHSRLLNFEIEDAHRFDLSIGNESFASLLLNDREIYSVQFNGTESLNGFDEFIGLQCDRREPSVSQIKIALTANPSAERAIVRDFLAADRAQNGEDDANAMIQRFAQRIGLGCVRH